MPIWCSDVSNKPGACSLVPICLFPKSRWLSVSLITAISHDIFAGLPAQRRALPAGCSAEAFLSVTLQPHVTCGSGVMNRVNSSADVQWLLGLIVALYRCSPDA